MKYKSDKAGKRVQGMKLLIVDDEKLTRDGLMNSIDWEQLGVDAVAQADGGRVSAGYCIERCADASDERD